jgi:hypothetical protein
LTAFHPHPPFEASNSEKMPYLVFKHYFLFQKVDKQDANMAIDRSPIPDQSKSSGQLTRQAF